MGVFALHDTQHLNGVKYVLGGGRGPPLEHGEEFRHVAVQRGVALTDAVQEIEVLGLLELLHLGNALGEGIPGDDGLDGGEWIASSLPGLDQHLADAVEQPHLGVDRLAGCLELLLMPLLGVIEQPAQDASVTVWRYP